MKVISRTFPRVPQGAAWPINQGPGVLWKRGRSELLRRKALSLLHSRPCHFSSTRGVPFKDCEGYFDPLPHCAPTEYWGSSCDSKQCWREWLCENPQKCAADNTSQKGDKIRAGGNILEKSGSKFSTNMTAVWRPSPGRHAKPPSGRLPEPWVWPLLPMVPRRADTVTWLRPPGAGGVAVWRQGPGTWALNWQGGRGQERKDSTQLAKSGALSEQAAYCKLPDTSGKLGPSAAKVQQFWERLQMPGRKLRQRQGRPLSAQCPTQCPAAQPCPSQRGRARLQLSQPPTHAGQDCSIKGAGCF